MRNSYISRVDLWNCQSRGGSVVARRVLSMPGQRRDPAWTHVIEQLSDDLHENPGGEGVFQRLKKLGFYDGPVD